MKEMYDVFRDEKTADLQAHNSSQQSAIFGECSPQNKDVQVVKQSSVKLFSVSRPTDGN